MDPPEKALDPTPEDRFLTALWRDVDTGRVRPVEAYVQAFPGVDPAVIRLEYLLCVEKGRPDEDERFEA